MEYTHSMNKIKLDDRIENAMNALFEAEADRSQFALTYTRGDAAIALDEATFAEKAGKWIGILREIFMFGPGTFYVFYSTLKMLYFYPTVGLNYYGFVLAVFFMYAGLGSLKEFRNLIVPAVVIVMAFAVAFISNLLPGKDVGDLYFTYSIYLLPNVLIAAKLIHYWVSDKK